MNAPILLLSSSVVHGYAFLEYSREAIGAFMSGLSTPLLFVPYAAHESGWDDYTARVSSFFATLNIPVIGLHTIQAAQLPHYGAVFVGGGNTFRLLATLQDMHLMQPLRHAVRSGTMRYMGSSAGSNLAGSTICTTNDMPIVYPRLGFDALGLIPYQINPHYLDPDPDSKHKGETRDQRLAEYHQANDLPVIGLREGAHLGVSSTFHTTGQLYIGGQPGAKIFKKDTAPYEAPRHQLFVL